MVSLKYVFFLLLMPAVGFTARQSFAESRPDEVDTEVMLYVNDDKDNLDRVIRVFNGLKGHWVPLKIDKGQEVVKYYSKGNLAFVITLDNLYGFSALTDKWARQPVNIGKQGVYAGAQVAINIDGNVGTVVFPNPHSSEDNVYGFSAHLGQWAKPD